MKALMSSWPRRGSCSEYFSSMSGDAMSSTTLRLTFSPQKSVNHRTTMALLSSSFLILTLLNWSREDTDIGRWPGQRVDPSIGGQTPVLTPQSKVSGQDIAK